jgi:hypothetical protein
LSLNWVNSEGGPLICVTPSASANWRGTNASSMGDARTDYVRACDVLDYLGVIPCGLAEVLVLGDAPLQSAFAVTDGDVVIVRWVSCMSNERAAEVIASLPSQLPVIGESVQFSVHEPCLFLFNAALDKPSVTESHHIAIESGRYTVTTESHKIDQEFEFLVHRFKRVVAS